jgi:formate hydrogenlyase transcriptional activator
MNKAIDTISCGTMDGLTRYPWPGNIRERENVIERAVILSPGPVLRVPLRDLQPHSTSRHSYGLSQTLEEIERKHILMTLKETRWVLSGPNGAAARLRLHRGTLYFRMKKLGIVRPGTKSQAPGILTGTE